MPSPHRRMLYDAIHNLLPNSQEGYTHLLTVIDRSSRWIEAIPIVSTSAQACADAFIGGWVARFGTPALITSERGPQFTSAVWTVMCQKLGIQHILTTADHPQANNMVERFHRQLKEDSGLASAEMVDGQVLCLPGQHTLFTSSVTEGVAKSSAVQPARPTPLPSTLTSSSAAGWRRFPSSASGRTGAERSLYWRCRPGAAARDEFRSRSSSRVDPLPADLSGGSCGERHYMYIVRNVLLINPPNCGVKKSGNLEARKKSSVLSELAYC
jgi:transposase InsO family protein